MKILLATTNDGKVKEFKKMLGELPFELLSLKDFSVREVEETGATFKENSTLKASEYALQTNCWTLADDSGLEVSALDNAPGVYSARYAGQQASDLANTEKLLAELSQTKDKQRLARFVCSISISSDSGEIRFSASGVCHGEISRYPKGTNGFGYDPVFIPKGFEKTFGELDDSEKRKISHRSKAMKQVITFLSAFPSS